MPGWRVSGPHDCTPPDGEAGKPGEAISAGFSIKTAGAAENSFKTWDFAASAAGFCGVFGVAKTAGQRRNTAARHRFVRTFLTFNIL